MSRKREHGMVTASAPRAAAVWAVVTGLAAGALSLGLPGSTATLRVTAGDAEWHRADVAIADLCSLVLVLATAWGWTATSTTVVGLLRGRTVAYGGVTRRLVLLACGAALVVPAGPAVASADGSSAGLHGLPYPDRPAAAALPTSSDPRGAEAPGGSVSRSGAGVVVVEPGDSLWSIAARTVAPPEPVEAHWRAIIAANPWLADPDVVLPGQRIALPGSGGAR